MLLAIEDFNVSPPGVSTVRRGSWLVGALPACLLAGCYPGNDHEAYELQLKCEVLSRGEGLVRTRMKDYHARRLTNFNGWPKANRDHYAGKIGKRSEDVRKESEAYLQKVNSALIKKDDDVIRDAVNAIEICIAGVYD